jgi:Predicted membrane protein
MKFQTIFYYIACFILFMSIICFTAMGIDKLKAKQNKRRIPEARLFLLAALGGGPGGILGIYVFRHKTLHKNFTIGFPLILVLQLAIIFYSYYLLAT